MCKSNVHKTVRKRPILPEIMRKTNGFLMISGEIGRLLNVLCTLNLRPVSRRNGLQKVIIFEYLRHVSIYG